MLGSVVYPLPVSLVSIFVSRLSFLGLRYLSADELVPVLTI